jgi:hypothetical protein
LRRSPAVAFYEHAYGLVRAHREAGRTAPDPLTVDGPIYASSTVMLDSARLKTPVPVPALARWLLGLGIAATHAANVAHSLGSGLTGAAVGARPVVALFGSYELLMMVIRNSQAPGTPCLKPSARGTRCGEPAAELFAGQLAEDRVPSVGAIPARLHVGQPRAQRLRDYLGTGAARRLVSPAA